MESPVMRDLAFWLCYSIIEQLMKKTTSSLLIPKIRFRLIKCHCWKGASSDLTIVSHRVATAPNGWSSEKVWGWEDKCIKQGREGEDGCLVGWGKDGKEEAEENRGERREAAGMDGWGASGCGCDGGVWKVKARLRDSCPICSIIIQCVSVWLGKDIIKETWGRLGSRSRCGSATLPSLLPLSLYNLPLFRVSFERSPFDP